MQRARGWAAVSACFLLGVSSNAGTLRFSAAPGNDLWQAVQSAGYASVRYATPGEAVGAATPGDAVVLLADGYPERTTPTDAALFQAVADRGIRMYVEYPSFLQGQPTAAPQSARWVRGVVASDFFAPHLARLQLLALHDCRYLPAVSTTTHLVLARVAGFDTAVYGLPAETLPLLFELPNGSGDGRFLVATTKLSHFRTGRYAPVGSWSVIWERILEWLQPGGVGARLNWTPTVRPVLPELSPVDERMTLRRGVEWFDRSGLILRPTDLEAYDRPANPLETTTVDWPFGHRVGWRPSTPGPRGDGSLGVLEGFDARVLPDGSQPVRWWRRGDCNGEIAGSLALASRVLNSPRYRTLAANIAHWFYADSVMSQGNRAQAGHPAFGLTGWNDVPNYYQSGQDGYAVYYADDNARAMLGMMLAGAALETDNYDERLMRCLLANLRLTGRLGFQPDRIDEAPLVARGWRAYFNDTNISLSPHYQAYLWACHLWAYRHTRFPLFLERARSGIRLTMEAYPHRWRWTNGIQQERARMLLPLAWLLRIENTEEVRGWLKRVAGDLLAAQDPCGAIREELGPGAGDFPPPASNEAYGTNEASLIQANGDPVCDLLYTVNFALLGLHEAAAATGDARLKAAEDRLAGFLCRIQARSEAHAELDGAWFRAFDYRRWEYWGSGADAGWGAWCIEAGWTQSWITAVLGLRQLDTSLWEYTGGSRVKREFEPAHRMLLGTAGVAGEQVLDEPNRGP